MSLLPSVERGYVLCVLIFSQFYDCSSRLGLHAPGVEELGVYVLVFGLGTSIRLVNLAGLVRTRFMGLPERPSSKVLECYCYVSRGLGMNSVRIHILSI